MTPQQKTGVERTALATIVDCVLSHKRLFLGVWATILAVSLLFAFLARPVYRAELVLAPVQEGGGGGLASSLGGQLGQLGQLASFAGISVGQDSDLQSNLAILESKKFTMLFIENNDLIPVLYEKDWDEAAETWRPGKERSNWEVLDRFSRKIRSVNVDAASGLVRLRIDWYSGDQAAAWANAMGRDLNDIVRQRAIAEANKSIQYLKEELAKNNLVGIDVAINNLIESQINKIMLANVRKDYAFQVIDPAMPPSPDAQLRPNRGLILAIGLVLGFLAGGFASILVGFRTDE